MAEVMKAVVFDTFGPPDVLTLKDVPVPSAEPGRVLIKLEAAGVNPVDALVRGGRLLKSVVPLPKIPGGDLSGTLLQDTARMKQGEKVFALTESFQPWYSTGTYAEVHSAKEEDVARMPASLSFEEAAGVPLVTLTAYQALKASGVYEGSRVLIHGGAGGVGSMAIQLAKAWGAHVITTVGPRNIDFVKQELGADEAIDYTSAQFDDVLKLSPVDVVISTRGGEVAARSARVLKRRGHYQRIASIQRQLSHETRSFLLILCRTIWGYLGLGPTFGSTCVRPDGAQLQQIADWVSEGKLKPVVDRAYPLERAADAHAYVEQAHTCGKVILRIGAK